MLFDNIGQKSPLSDTWGHKNKYYSRTISYDVSSKNAQRVKTQKKIFTSLLNKQILI